MFKIPNSSQMYSIERVLHDPKQIKNPGELISGQRYKTICTRLNYQLERMFIFLDLLEGGFARVKYLDEDKEDENFSLEDHGLIPRQGSLWHTLNYVIPIPQEEELETIFNKLDEELDQDKDELVLVVEHHYKIIQGYAKDGNRVLVNQAKTELHNLLLDYWREFKENSLKRTYIESQIQEFCKLYLDS